MALSAGTTLGPYRIDSLLGVGGMGEVYRAHDPRLGRDVAIKVLAAGFNADGDSLRQLEREARAAAALNHPNICTVYEVGRANHWAFIAMEYVDGRPLRTVVDRAPLSIEDVVRYGIEAADALAHAHDRGVLHGDLKTANAIISASGRLKIVDFGLARRLARATSDTTTLLSQVGTAAVAGTPYAMAPEQVRGAIIDTRTDVWALGVLLYEMLTGHEPFRASTLADLFSSILRDVPAPLPPHIPGPLQEIVIKCLAKDPSRRYERAADVRLVLEAMTSSFRCGVSPPPAPHVPAGAPLPPPPFLHDATGFIGRTNELAHLSHVWQQAIGGQRRLILIGGEPGIGKTCLSTEFARTCAAHGATVIVGRSDEEALVPYQPFVEALSWYVRVCPERELRTQLAEIGGGGELGLLILDLLRRIPDLPTPPALNPEGQRYRFLEAVDALLSTASVARPMLIVLDDLHWADKPTLLMLRHLLRSTRPGPLCIVATYRESELGRAMPFAETLADLRREQAVTRLSLRGLEPAQVRTLIAALAGVETPPQLSRMLIESTAGNPFFIAEIVRHLGETGALARFGPEFASRQSVIDLGLPEGVKEVIGRRLSRLSPSGNKALSLAAVIGREFDLDILLALGDLPEEKLLDAIDEAVSARLICEAPGRPGRFSFMHALIRETLHGELSSSRRIRLHRRVGEAIEGLARGHPNPPLADLAYHFVQAAPTGVVAKAIDYAIRAGDRAAEAAAHEEAVKFYDMALQSLELTENTGVKQQADLHTRRARAFGALGHWTLEKAELEHALRYLDPAHIERRCEILLDLAVNAFWLLDIPSVERLASQALELANEAHRSDLAANAIGWLARCRQSIGDLDGAVEMDRRALALGGGGTVALAQGPLSLYLAGHSTEAVTLAARAAEAARSSRDPTFVMYALSHYGLSLGAVGSYAAAAKVFEDVQEFGRKYGMRPLIARAMAMSAGFHLSVFDLDGAEQLQSEARELAASLAFAPPLVSASIDLLLTLARRRDPGRAEKLLEDTVAKIASTPNWHEWLWQLRLSQARAELAVARGAFDVAMTNATESINQSRTRRRPKYETLGLATRARALHGLGRTHEAIADAQRSVAVARQTSDPALLLVAIDVLLTLDGRDELANEARALAVRILDALPDETMRRRFSESEIGQRVALL